MVVMAVIRRRVVWIIVAITSIVGFALLAVPWLGSSSAQSAVPGARSNLGRPLTNPGNRCCMAFAYDSSDNLYIMFGGTSNGTGNWSDTWTGRLSNSTFTWQQPTVVCAPISTVCPPARHSTRMAYDPTDNLVVMYGGEPSLGDTWVGQVSNNGNTLTWTKQCGTGTCPPQTRSSPGLAWDPAIPGMVMYGGFNGSGAKLNDTWVGTWSSSTSSFTWESTARCSGSLMGTGRRPAAACGPGARASAALAYDSDASQLVLFGGEGNAPTICGGSTGQQVCGDTWVFNGTTWDNKTQTSPPSNLARSGHRMIYDDVHHRLVMFGGFTDPSDPGTDNNDTFVAQWSSGKYSWTQASPSTAPQARCCVGLAFQNGSNSAIILFGGGDVNHFELNDTWRGRLGSGTFTWDCLLSCTTGSAGADASWVGVR
jgi:hypothetical protein